MSEITRSDEQAGHRTEVVGELPVPHHSDSGRRAMTEMKRSSEHHVCDQFEEGIWQNIRICLNCGHWEQEHMRSGEHPAPDDPPHAAVNVQRTTEHLVKGSEWPTVEEVLTALLDFPPDAILVITGGNSQKDGPYWSLRARTENKR